MSQDSLDVALTKIRTQTGSTIPAVKRPAALLTAIDETLSKQATTSNIPKSAYLVALNSTLTQLVSTPAVNKPGDKRELLEATLYLLGVLCPHLSNEVLKSRISIMSSIVPLFQSFSTQAPVIKSLISITQSILTSLTQNQLEKDLSTRTAFASILQLSGDPRPKVRRRAQEAVIALLSSPPPPAQIHPYSEETCNWILTRLEDAVKGAKRGGKKETVVESKGTKAAAAVAAAVGGEESGVSDESRAIALLTFIRNLGTAWSDEVSCE